MSADTGSIENYWFALFPKIAYLFAPLPRILVAHQWRKGGRSLCGSRAVVEGTGILPLRELEMYRREEYIQDWRLCGRCAPIARKLYGDKP